MLCRVRDLDLNSPDVKSIRRAGVIYYTFTNNKLQICMGKDAYSGDLTDFGGLRSRRLREHAVRCAVREANEESRCVFGRLRVPDVQDYHCIHNNIMLIIFVPVYAPENMDMQLFVDYHFHCATFITENQKKKHCYNELTQLVWLLDNEIEDVFNKYSRISIFYKVRSLIGSFFEDIETSKNLLLDVPHVRVLPINIRDMLVSKEKS